MGSRIQRCQRAPRPAPPPTFAQRMTRNASRSNGVSASNGGAAGDGSRGSAAGSSATELLYRAGQNPGTSLAMISFMISLVPPPMLSSRASRKARAMGVSTTYPMPPWNCMQS